MRQARLAQAEPARIQTRQQSPALRLGKPLYGVLSLGEADGVHVLACGDCGAVICPERADYHDYLPSRARRPGSLGHKTVREDWQAYREYCCPGCGALIDVAFEEAGAVPRASA